MKQLRTFDMRFPASLQGDIPRHMRRLFSEPEVVKKLESLEPGEIVDLSIRRSRPESWGDYLAVRLQWWE